MPQSLGFPFTDTNLKRSNSAHRVCAYSKFQVPCVYENITERKVGLNIDPVCVTDLETDLFYTSMLSILDMNRCPKTFMFNNWGGH